MESEINKTSRSTHEAVSDVPFDCDDTLKALFSRGFKEFCSTYRTASTSPEDDDGFPRNAPSSDQPLSRTEVQQQHSAILHLFHRLAFCIEKASIFSPNEDLEDIHTTDLMFLLVPFILGELYYAFPFLKDERERVAQLENALLYWKRFLTVCVSYGLCDEKKLNRLSGTSATPDLGARRTEKIEAFRRQRELVGQIRHLLEIKNKVADPYVWGTGAVDDEVERALALALIERSINEALDHADTAKLEVDLLSSRLDSTRVEAEPVISAPKANEPRRLPYVIRIEDASEIRKAYRDKVFQPYHELPSISLAEVAAWEMDLETRQLGNPTGSATVNQSETFTRDRRGTSPSASDSEEEKENPLNAGNPQKTRQKTEMEQRAWDDWKDENPKGWGNKNRNVS